MESLNEQINNKTNDELVEIYIKQDDFQLEFCKAVIEELSIRGIALAPLDESKKNAREINDEEYKKGFRGNRIYLILNFFAPLLGFLVPLLFLAPFFSGYRYWFKKRTDPYRVAHYYYDEQTRKYGKWLFIFGCVMIVFYVIVKDIYK